MAVKISVEDKKMYLNMVQTSHEKIEKIKKKEKDLLVSVSGKSSGEKALAHLSLADQMLNLVTSHLEIDAVSKSFLNVKNEKALNDARKTVYKSLIYMENVVTDFVDRPFSDYQDKLAEIASFDTARRYQLVEKMGKTLTQLKEAYGSNTKWKWTFVELDGRYAAVAKNLMDLKKAIANMEPISPHYEHTIRHLRVIKNLLGHAAERYREKYEMATFHIDDFQKGINFLGSLFRIHALTGERNEAIGVKKKLEIWNSKLENDIKTKKTLGVKTSEYEKLIEKDK